MEELGFKQGTLILVVSDPSGILTDKLTSEIRCSKPGVILTSGDI